MLVSEHRHRWTRVELPFSHRPTWSCPCGAMTHVPSGRELCLVCGDRPEDPVRKEALSVT